MNKKGKIALVSALVLAAIFLVAMVFAIPGTRAVKACRDGIDNDGDGYVDWPNDPGCANKNDNSELNPNIECDDGIDNDGDSSIDMNDAGCSSPSDTDETNCGDGICEGPETIENCAQDCGQPDSCSDTDSGFVPEIFGTTSGYYNGEPYSSDDYCYDSDVVFEYYCNGDYETFQAVNCGNDTYSAPYCTGDSVYKDLTDNFCAAGACDSTSTPELQEDCNSYDTYGPNYCDGYDNVFRNKTDFFCSSGACDYDITPEFVEYCPYGCVGGECNEGTPDSCNDTDGGLIYDIQGTVSGYINQSYYEYTDYCLSNVTVMEHACSIDAAYSFPHECSLACIDGACV